MEPEGSLLSSQELSTCTYPEPDQFSPQWSIMNFSYVDKNSLYQPKSGNKELVTF
jgi:hypothetical protein